MTVACPNRCRGSLGLSLSSLFCEPVGEFWHLQYLHNYVCCSQTRYSPQSIKPEIRDFIAHYACNSSMNGAPGRSNKEYRHRQCLYDMIIS